MLSPTSIFPVNFSVFTCSYPVFSIVHEHGKACIVFHCTSHRAEHRPPSEYSTLGIVRIVHVAMKELLIVSVLFLLAFPRKCEVRMVVTGALTGQFLPASARRSSWPEFL